MRRRKLWEGCGSKEEEFGYDCGSEEEEFESD